MHLRWKIAQWFELRWWKNYLGGKEKESYLEWKRNYWERIIEQGLTSRPPSTSAEADQKGDKEDKGDARSSRVARCHWCPLSPPFGLFSEPRVKFKDKKIIDFGCGPAGIFITLPENDVVAVDPLLDDYEKNILFFKKSDYPKTTFIKSTIEEFETEQKFDLIFCMNAINHVQNIKCGFEKLKHVCADDGIIIISIDAHNFSFFKYLFRLIPGDILHPHQYDLKEYENFVADNGWQIVNARLLKSGFVFDHYLLVARKPCEAYKDS